METQEVIKIVPSDNMFYELGKTNYTLEEALSELIDNSISARIDNSLQIDICFKIDKNTKKCNELIITDNASGIKKKNIGACISPAEKQTKNSLNEHGLGLKSSVSSLGELNYLKTKTKDETGYSINKFQWNLELNKATFNFDHGTEISINVENSKLVNINKHNYKDIEIEKLKNTLGARYRKLLAKIDLDLMLHVQDESDIYTVRVTSLQPAYYNPWGVLNKPLIYKKIFTYADCIAELTFGYAPKDEFEHESIGLNMSDYTLKPNVKGGVSCSHPYAIFLKNSGLDLIMNDRIIIFKQLDEIGLFGSREYHYNQIRGEINLVRGFQTTSTKNGVQKTEAFCEIIKQIKFYLSNGSDGEISKEDKEKFRNDYGKNLLTNKYLQGAEKGQHETEIELKDKIEKILNSHTSKYSDIKREYPISELGGIVDFLVDNQPWEIKNVKAVGHDVSQLLTYMISVNSKNGVLIAPGFNDACFFLKKVIKQQLGFDIQLLPSQDFE